MTGGPRGTPPPHNLRAVEARIAEIEADLRYQSGLKRPATVFENAPLALIQLGFEQELLALKQLALPVVAHARALREALRRLHNVALRVTLVPSGATPEWLLALDEAAAVLAAAQDGPA